MEIYTVNNYYIQKSQENFITSKHNHILQHKPVKLEDIVKESEKLDITKIMPIAINENADKIRLTEMFENLNTGLTLSWGIHPIANPLRFGIITAKDISKKQGAIEISKNINVPLENILAVGDSTSDWQFIDLCGFGAAMGNATQKLKELVSSKASEHFYIGKNVCPLYEDAVSRQPLDILSFLYFYFYSSNIWQNAVWVSLSFVFPGICVLHFSQA